MKQLSQKNVARRIDTYIYWPLIKAKRTFSILEADKLKFYRSGQTNQVSAQATDHLEVVVGVVFVEADVATEAVVDSVQFEDHGMWNVLFFFISSLVTIHKILFLGTGFF